MTRHDDLGDDELYARLTQRGYNPTAAANLVRDRDDPRVADKITTILNGVIRSEA